MKIRPAQVVIALLAAVGLDALLVVLLARKAASSAKELTLQTPQVEFQIEAPDIPEPPRRPPKPSERLPSRRRAPAPEPPPIAKAAPYPSALKDPAVGLNPALRLSDTGLGRDPAQTSEVAEAEEVTDPPSVLRQQFPRYPPSAAARGVEGFVVVRLLIDRSGRVRRARVVRADPPGVFEEAALAALRAWRFRPARDEGRAVAVWARQTLRFELR